MELTIQWLLIWENLTAGVSTTSVFPQVRFLLTSRFLIWKIKEKGKWNRNWSTLCFCPNVFIGTFFGFYQTYNCSSLSFLLFFFDRLLSLCFITNVYWYCLYQVSYTAWHSNFRSKLVVLNKLDLRNVRKVYLTLI